MAELALAVALPAIGAIGSALLGGGPSEPGAPTLVQRSGIWGWLANRHLLEQFRIAERHYQRQMRERTIRMIVVSVVYVVLVVAQVTLSSQVLNRWNSQPKEVIAALAIPACLMCVMPRFLFALFGLQ